MLDNIKHTSGGSGGGTGRGGSVEEGTVGRNKERVQMGVT